MWCHSIFDGFILESNIRSSIYLSIFVHMMPKITTTHISLNGIIIRLYHSLILLNIVFQRLLTSSRVKTKGAIKARKPVPCAIFQAYGGQRKWAHLCRKMKIENDDVTFLISHTLYSWPVR